MKWCSSKNLKNKPKIRSSHWRSFWETNVSLYIIKIHKIIRKKDICDCRFLLHMWTLMILLKFYELVHFSHHLWAIKVTLNKVIRNWKIVWKPQKNVAFSNGISCLQVIFVLIWMKKTLICFNLQRDRTGNGLPNINTFCRMFAAANVSSEPKYVHQAGLSSS